MENTGANPSYILHLTKSESTRVIHLLEIPVAATKGSPKDVAVSKEHTSNAAFGHGTAPTMHADIEGHSESTYFCWARKA